MIGLCLAMVALVGSAFLVQAQAASSAGVGLEPWVVALVGGASLVILVVAGVLAFREWHHEHPE